jgi:hypothetical protein
MRTCFLFLLFVAFASMPAYAHRRHHHHHRHEHSTAIGRWHDDQAREKSNAPSEVEARDSEHESRVPVGASPDRQPSPSDENTAGNWLPPGWQQQAADPKWQGKRFVSPDGMGSFSAYITLVAQEPIAQHMKNVAFGDGEQITHLRGANATDMETLSLRPRQQRG